MVDLENIRQTVGLNYVKDVYFHITTDTVLTSTQKEPGLAVIKSTGL